MSTLTQHDLSQQNGGSELAAEVSALLDGAGVYSLSAGWIAARGEDAVRWLNGMLTNNIRDLKAGEGNYNFLLNAQGQIQGDAYVFQEGDRLLIETSGDRVAGMMAQLDHFIIMDDVELADLSAQWKGVGVAGPKAGESLQKLGLRDAEMPPLTMKKVSWHGQEAIVIAAYGPVVPRFEIWAEQVEEISAELKNAGAVIASDAALDALRLMEGTPLLGKDIREKGLPQETAQMRALHFAKGCYLGQEIVERIRSRGNVHKTIASFRLQGAFPGVPAAITVNGSAVGELTSAMAVPVGGKEEVFAIGTIRREALDRGDLLSYEGGTLEAVATGSINKTI